jgi:glycosyltransferase involved in cell wall biosynthesis
VIQVYYPVPNLSIKRSIESVEKAKVPTVLHVGRMEASERYKGHDEVIESWPIVQAKVPDAQLIFIGTGNDRERLARKVSDLDYRDQIRFLGQVSDEKLAEQYQKSWLFCMPSSREGQGLVYGEAMQFGLPIIALRNSPASEQIRHEKEGVLLEDKSPDEIAEKILHLFAHPEQRNAYGIAAQKRYHWLQNKTQQFWDTLNELRQ